ncbi:hypothetical protein [Bordetella sp. N]|uniref:hypothetical protein n=1 Tax=Bordetella sp. N TaxID=1746199 RepID=UPI00070A7792|nr:hypothetical protein [Bordetella sp. N]ALM83798.1 hypothetical protein ASB57_13170 [Bordetella sp. N]
MALVLARFAFGFSLTWIIAGVLLLATLLCIRLVGIAVVAFVDERRGNVAGAAVVALLVIGALALIYFLGDRLHAALGASMLSDAAANWVAGGNHLSAAAVFGAMSGIAALAAIPAWLNRPRLSPEEKAARAEATQALKEKLRQERAKAKEKAEKEHAKAVKAEAKAGAAAAKEAKAAAKAAGASTGSKRAKAADTAPRGPRRAGLGWTALFMLLLGAAMLAFAFSVAPLSPPRNANAASIGYYQTLAERARPIYIAGGGLVGAGLLLLILWQAWRRPE